MLTLQQITEKMEKLDNWILENDSIIRIYDFPDFAYAMKFANKVAEIAEKENHHPEIFINESNVRLSLTTNSVKGLSEKDFKVAEEIDKIKLE